MTRRNSGAWPRFFRSLRPVKPPTPPAEQPPEQDAPKQEETPDE